MSTRQVFSTAPVGQYPKNPTQCRGDLPRAASVATEKLNRNRLSCNHHNTGRKKPGWLLVVEELTVQLGWRACIAGHASLPKNMTTIRFLGCLSTKLTEKEVARDLQEIVLLQIYSPQGVNCPLNWRTMDRNSILARSSCSKGGLGCLVPCAYWPTRLPPMRPLIATSHGPLHQPPCHDRHSNQCHSQPPYNFPKETHSALFVTSPPNLLGLARLRATHHQCQHVPLPQLPCHHRFSIWLQAPLQPSLNFADISPQAFLLLCRTLFPRLNTDSG